MARYHTSTALPPAGTGAGSTTVVDPAQVDAEIAGSHATVYSLLVCGAGGDDGGLDVHLADNAVHPVNDDQGCSHSLDHGAHADVSDVQVVPPTTRVGQLPVTRSIDRSAQDSLVEVTAGPTCAASTLHSSWVPTPTDRARAPETTMAVRSMPDHSTMRPRSTLQRLVSVAGDEARR